MAARYQSRHSSSSTASRTAFRGAGRPSLLSLSAAAAIAAAAAVASGVVAGPESVQAVNGRLSIAAGPARAASHHQRKRANPARSSPGSSAPSASPSASSAPPDQPLQFYDSITPAAVPAGNVIAAYATGRYAVPAAAVAGRPTIWIDCWATDPGASVLDVEPGDATPAMAATWVAQKLGIDPNARARLYTMLGEWPALQAAIATLPSWMQARVRYWIADPTGVPHMVPGANATQWYWGQSYDISTANPGF